MRICLLLEGMSDARNKKIFVILWVDNNNIVSISPKMFDKLRTKLGVNRCEPKCEVRRL